RIARRRRGRPSPNAPPGAWAFLPGSISAPSAAAASAPPGKSRSDCITIAAAPPGSVAAACAPFVNWSRPVPANDVACKRWPRPTTSGSVRPSAAGPRPGNPGGWPGESTAPSQRLASWSAGGPAATRGANAKRTRLGLPGAPSRWRGSRRRSGSGQDFIQPNPDDRAHTRLLHRHAVDPVRGFHRARVVRDDDELGFALELLEHRQEAPDVGFVQWRVHLVQHTERARLDQVDGEQQRERGERAFAAAQQVDPLGPLATRGSRDLDGRLERVVRVGQPDVTLAALEQRLEGPAEVRADLLERLHEELPRGAVDLTDRCLEVVASPDQVVALRREELEPLALLLVLLHREHVDRAETVEIGGDGLELCAERIGLTLDGLRLLLELGERPPPLGLQALADAAARPLLLRAQQVQAVPLFSELLGGPAQFLGPRLELLGRGHGLLRLLVEAAELGLQLVARR